MKQLGFLTQQSIKRKIDRTGMDLHFFLAYQSVNDSICNKIGVQMRYFL